MSDEPLLRYLGVSPNGRKFEPTMWTRAMLLDRVEEIRHTAGATELNRCTLMSWFPFHAPNYHEPKLWCVVLTLCL